jgi:2-keto-4-pentenoate hydratase/2-oxohepta-3-ene-1,7-dioic acid hydratase in catechol pathway
MKFASFELHGQPTWGLATAKGLVAVTAAQAEQYPTLQDAIAADALPAVGRALAGGKAVHSADGPLLPLLSHPPRIFCIGLNYELHRQETGRSETPHPTIFMRFGASQVGHNQPMLKPKESDMFDYEGELAVIIGKGGRRIAEAQAMGAVCGYSCFNDGSVRDWQRHTSQFTPGKNFAASGAFGPCLVTADEIPDPTRLSLYTRLNGNVMQETTTDHMIFDIPRLIAYISTWTELLPGDVIATGTPGGVGAARDPQVFMKPGDVVEVDISGVGVLRNPIVEG